MTRFEVNAAMRLLEDYFLTQDVKATRGELSVDDLRDLIKRLGRLAACAEILDDDLRGEFGDGY